MKKYLLISLLVLMPTISFSEDIELYVSEAVKLAGACSCPEPDLKEAILPTSGSSLQNRPDYSQF